MAGRIAGFEKPARRHPAAPDADATAPAAAPTTPKKAPKRRASAKPTQTERKTTAPTPAVEAAAKIATPSGDDAPQPPTAKEALVPMAARVPADVRRRVKIVCARFDIKSQDFVTHAVVRELERYEKRVDDIAI